MFGNFAISSPLPKHVDAVGEEHVRGWEIDDPMRTMHALIMWTPLVWSNLRGLLVATLEACCSNGSNLRGLL